jgi:lysyl-tRNA synthetase, class II
VRKTFRLRSKMISFLRRFMEEHGFLEVETPMLHPVAGGATARPFVTHHNTLNMELYMRIAPELYLKRLVAGGLDRVFEINRCFRNEGVSTFHNPEFTTLEFYQAYANCDVFMDLAEDMLSQVTQSICGTTDIEFMGHSISMAKPFHRVSMLDAIVEHSDLTLDNLKNEVEATAALAATGLKVKGLDLGHVQLGLFEHFAESKLIQPTIVYDHPASVSPLARRKSSDPTFVERFELFIAGKELVNAFSELNDPIDQKGRFEAQLKRKEAGDLEAHDMDHDFVRALEHGLPPTAGLGLGIDRLAMMLTNSKSIRDVLFFPLLRPEA